MTRIKEIKSTLGIALPLIAAFLAQKGMQFIDTMMMGWLGPAGLAAGAMGTAIFITIIVFCMGTLSAVGVFISRAKGANNEHDIKSSLQNGIGLALLLSLPCILIAWFAPHLLIKKENADVLHNATLLLHGLSLGLPGYLLFLVFREFISTFSFTKIVMIITIISIPLTFLLNYILIYGKFGLPQLGVAGIGYAGAIVMWFMFLGLFLYTFRKPQLKKLMEFNFFEFSLSKIKDMLYIGIPSGLFFLLESAMFLSAVIIMGFFGVDELASFQITMQCANIAYSIPFALSMATALQVSHAVGANELYRIKHVAIQNLSIGVIFSIVVATCFILFPNFFIGIFLTEEGNQIRTVQIASSFLVIAAFFQVFDAVQTIANGVLRGFKDTFIPMLLSVGCYWLIGIASCYYFSFYTSLGAKGIWYGISFGIGSLAIVLIIRFFIKLKSISS